MATTNTHIAVVRGSIVGGKCKCGLAACERSGLEAEERRKAIIRAQEAVFEDLHLPTRCVGAERLKLSLAVSLDTLCAA